MTTQVFAGISALPADDSPNQKCWYRPTFSPEHGVLLVLLGAVLTGAALAQAWTTETSWACLATFLALQAEHPVVVQIKRRRKWRPRYVVWAGVYGGLAIAIALFLCLRHPVLFWVVGAALIALSIDVLSVLNRSQKSSFNEIVMFSAICLSTLFAYGATAGTLTTQSLGLWILNSLFFSSAVFSVKLRKSKTRSLKHGIIYHSIAASMIVLLYGVGWLSLLTALGFAIASIKLLTIACCKQWYQTCRFEHIARFETYFALIYTALIALTVLPAKLPVS
ncbi:MAG: YwiC-like family protein [Cyanobacteria bacterium J06621_11]